MLNSGIRLIAGLGNPGDKYQQTRHNVGFWFLEALQHKYSFSVSPDRKLNALTGQFRFEDDVIRVIAPQTYMNLSGDAIVPLANYYQINSTEILVVHDELDLPCGSARLKKNGGHGGHNGLKDLISKLGTQDFYRLRIGIDRPSHSGQVASYVLAKPDKIQTEALHNSIADAITVSDWLLDGEFNRAMNQLNTRNNA